MKEIGYKNHYQVLNAKDYGIPQERKRVFVVSVLNNLNFKFPTPYKNVPDIKDYIDHKVDFERYKLSDNEMHKTRRGRVGKRTAKTLTTSPNQVIYYNGKLRKLTAKEHWLLMGFDESDYNRVLHDNIKESHLYKLAGNSIVVQVLEAIFEEVLKMIKDDALCQQ
ncbi:uncharacterized protein LOC107885607 [Acyrthosiphon pisum]|uniref:tRNA (cytosine(38)-C(5))-methyltransferase n=1 Tax=Acyrthosiphon pisum TaxID=7029 RepID=A0A8R2D7G4_ACYPI|nr:uncharacterized protein LOC107885607 [Acyrthosiphon pisum]|eukprot:XP_016664764.1 PREDICTED: modification methylase ScrFIB-like [Acyrthosiphon pisum]